MNALAARLKPALFPLLIAVLMSSVTVAQAASARSSREFTPQSVVVSVPLGQNEAPLEMTIQQLMDAFKVPGLSVAATDHCKIAWARTIPLCRRPARSEAERA